MLKCYKHKILNFPAIFSNSIIVPGGITKLTGVFVVGDKTCNAERTDSNREGFRVRLMVNNKADNPINIDIHDSYLNVFNNVNEAVRMTPLNYELKPQMKLDYIIIGDLPNLPGQAVKVYLRFE